MKTAQELRDIKSKFDKSLESEIAFVSSVFQNYSPLWDKNNEFKITIRSVHYFEIEKYLIEYGYSVKPDIGHDDLDTILKENKSITIIATW